MIPSDMFQLLQVRDRVIYVSRRYSYACDDAIVYIQRSGHSQHPGSSRTSSRCSDARDAFAFTWVESVAMSFPLTSPFSTRCRLRTAPQSAAPMVSHTENPPADILRSPSGLWAAGRISGCTGRLFLHTQTKIQRRFQFPQIMPRRHQILYRYHVIF